MKVSVADKEKSQKELSVEIPAESYKEVFEAEFGKVAKTVKVAGFREGKAPRDVVMKEKGHQIRVYALEKVINDAVRDAIEKNEIRAMGQPEVKDVKFEDDNEPITFKVYVDVFPTFEVESYKGFEFTKEVNEVSAEDVDTVIENIRGQKAAFEPVEGDDVVVENGNMVVLDFEGSMNDEVIPSACAKDYSLEIGSNTFVPGFEEQVVGLKKGEEKDITVTFPENYHEKSMAGQPIVFKIKINEVKTKALPELDDAFAQEVDEKYETFAQLKEEIEKDLKAESDEMAKDGLYNQILDKVIEENAFDIPMVMVKEQADRLVEQTLRQYSMYGMTPEQLGINKDQLAEQNYPIAERQVKSALVINKIAEKEDIKPSEEDVNNALADYAAKYNKEVEDFKKELEQYGGLQSFENTVFTNLVYDFLVAENKVEEKVVTKAERDAKVAEAAAEAGEEA
jgi:trigger factor